MKILWITNFVLPSSGYSDVKKIMSGTWLEAMLKSLSAEKDVQLYIGMFSGKYSPPRKVNGIGYYRIAAKRQLFSFKSNYGMRKEIRALISSVSPDIVHIQGTEYPRSEAVIDECRRQNVKVVASVQGLIYICGYTIPQQAFFCRRRGTAEKSMINKLDAVLGRTDWDRAHVKEIAPKTLYSHSPELLRPVFYENRWSEPRDLSVLVGNMSSPLKGLHIVLNAMKLLHRDFPGLKLRIIGECLYEPTRIKRKLLKKSYINYISSLIEELDLYSSIEWLGECTGGQIVKAMKKSKVYIQASSIENSPNSLAEALQIGMPVVVSDVGGTVNMVEHGKDGFVYRFGDVSVLAYYTAKLLRTASLMKEISDYSYSKNKNAYSDGSSACKKLLENYRGIIADE
jgi:glycosyltransferase involved in cell wall biosynthesis